jgi:DNA processing protein
LALEQNREVLAVPGNITSEFSRGTNWLIRTGAGLVSTWQDVVEELPAPWNRDLMGDAGEESEPAESLGDRERAVFDLLLPDALVHVDEMVEKSGLSVSEVLTTLLSLEIKGRIVQRPGHYFQRKL